MTASEQTDLWAKIAGLKLRLVAHTMVYCHQLRGQPWYVLHDKASARHYRFSAGCHNFITQLDGLRTIQEIWDALQSQPQQPDVNLPTKDDVVRLVAQLHDAEILQGDVQLDSAAIFARRQQQLQTKSRMRWLRPLSIRFTLADPDKLLTTLLPYITPLFSRAVFVFWVLFVSAATIMATAHYSGLVSHWSSRALDPQNILLMFIVYPVIKALHEMGHAAATKVWGGEVHEMGIMLLVFMPNPFVDASSSSAFINKNQRIIVAASGIIIELFLAAAGFFVWLNVGPGMVSDIAFNVMFIGSVSTLLFNGNPLLRFDGYYVLMDAIEIPNLGQRSTRYLTYLVKHYLFGLPNEVSPVTAKGERSWFIIYGILAFFYRIFISFTIALYVAGKFFIIGFILAIWALAGQIIIPLSKSLLFLLTDTSLQGRRMRATGFTATGLLTIGIVVFLMPSPSWTMAEGILRLPEQSLVRANGNGFIVKVAAEDGKRVNKGDPLVHMDDPLLASRIAVLNWNLKELEAKQTAEFLQNRAQAGIFQEAIDQVKSEVTELKEQINKQIVRSAATGIFVVTSAGDTPGRFVHKGELLGHVVDLSTLTVRVVVPQQASDKVRSFTKSVEARFPHQAGKSITGSIEQEVPLITDRLPGRILGTQAGGAIAVDARDSEGLQTLEQIYQLDVALPPGKQDVHPGSKVYVRFNHYPEPLARQWYRNLRQLFLSRFEV